MSQTCGGAAVSDVYEMHVCADTAEDLALQEIKLKYSHRLRHSFRKAYPEKVQRW